MDSSPFTQPDFGIQKINNGKYIIVYLDRNVFELIIKLTKKNINDYPKMKYYLLDIIVNQKCKYIKHYLGGLKTHMQVSILERILFDNYKTRTIFTLSIVDNKIVFPIVLSRSVKALIIRKLINCEDIDYDSII
jgi:hypothetical protein